VTLSRLGDYPLPDASLLIGEERVSSSSAGTAVHYFAATGEADPPIPLAGAAEIDRAVAAARAGFHAWCEWTPDRRRDALLRLADLVVEHGEELIALSIRDSSFPVAVARLGPERAAGGLRYYAGWADKIGGEVVPTWFGPAFDYVVEEPFGVIAIFATWNTPVYNVGLTIAPALAAGNAVVVKPSELAPYAYLRFGELCLEAGLPPGLVNVVPGGAGAGRAITVHPGVDKVHFTGGGPAGTSVAALAASVLKPIDLELGGKAANLVFPDCDLEDAVRTSMGAVIGGSGQTCITASRMLVHETLLDKAVEIAVALAESAVVGHPFDPSTTMGPVISAAARDRMMGMIARAQDEGAKLCTGGGRPATAPEGGFYLEPTVLRDVAHGSELSQHEVYGPVLAVSSFATEDEAVALANGTAYGLSAYLQTNDVKRAHRLAARLQAGSVYINGRGGLPPAVPFGGYKQSGYGRLGGREGLRAFLQTKNVWMAL
jgi:acyl-CoA reductase-like NAD-dependent aldehyde dehydrogenase